MHVAHDLIADRAQQDSCDGAKRQPLTLDVLRESHRPGHVAAYKDIVQERQSFLVFETGLKGMRCVGTNTNSGPVKLGEERL